MISSLSNILFLMLKHEEVAYRYLVGCNLNKVNLCSYINTIYISTSIWNWHHYMFTHILIDFWVVLIVLTLCKLLRTTEWLFTTVSVQNLKMLYQYGSVNFSKSVVTSNVATLIHYVHWKWNIKKVDFQRNDSFSTRTTVVYTKLKYTLLWTGQ